MDDVRVIRGLCQPYVDQRFLAPKPPVAYYESIHDFTVALAGQELVGCGALHAMWEDLGEVRTLAVAQAWLKRGIGGQIVEHLIARARLLGLRRLFCLTFEVSFFKGHGFEPIESTPVTPEVYSELLQSHDDGVAEFLDLARVKPNILGNTRMLLHL